MYLLRCKLQVEATAMVGAGPETNELILIVGRHCLLVHNYKILNIFSDAKIDC